MVFSRLLDKNWAVITNVLFKLFNIIFFGNLVIMKASRSELVLNTLGRYVKRRQYTVLWSIILSFLYTMHLKPD